MIVMIVRGLKDMEQGETAVATRFTWFKEKVEGRKEISELSTAT